MFSIVTIDQKNICNGKAKTRHKEGYNVFNERAWENSLTSKEASSIKSIYRYQIMLRLQFADNVLFANITI